MAGFILSGYGGENPDGSLKKIAHVIVCFFCVRFFGRGVWYYLGNITKGDNKMKNKIRDILNRLSFEDFISVSRIQRFFRVGYSRACRFIDKMQELNIIEPYKDGKTQIIDKERFLEEGTKEIFENWNINAFFDYEILNNSFLDSTRVVTSALDFLAVDEFAKKIDEVLGTKLEKIDSADRRRENFYDLVACNEARRKIVEFIVSDYVSYNLKQNLKMFLDEYWLNKINNYKSFLEDNKNDKRD